MYEFLNSALEIASVAVSPLLGLVTLLIAWMTFKVARESKIVAERSMKVAEESRQVAERSYETSRESLDVAIKDWQQVGREAPWTLTKLYEDFWLLERLHHEPAAIVAPDVEPQCSGSSMYFCTPSGMPMGVFRRADKIVMKIPATNPGTDLVLYYREFTGDETLPSRPESFFAGYAWSNEGIEARKGTKSWSTPLY